MSALRLSLEIKVELEREVRVGTAAFIDLSLSELIRAKSIPGVVDEHSFSMEEIHPAPGKRIPVQFSSALHPPLPDDLPPVRPAKPAPPGAIPKAYPTALRYSCREQGGASSCRGRFTWLLDGGGGLSRRYLLYFEVAQDGEFMQCPSPPHQFVVFRPDKSVTPVKQFPAMEIMPHINPDGWTGVHKNQKQIAVYNYSPRYARPFIYPLIGPSGVEMTTNGKPHDPTDSHIHHNSLWIGHQSVGGVNFWEGWPDSGRIVHQRFDALESGPVFAGIRERNRWERNGRVYAYETRAFRVYNTPGEFGMIDVRIQLEPENDGPLAGDLVIGKNIWGFLAIRLKESMTPTDGGGEIRNAQGRLNEEDAIWERSEWCDIAGPVNESEWNGAAIFDHPGNPTFPTGWQCRNDGFICTSFSIRDDYVVKRNHKLVVNHRVYLHKGNAAEGNVAQAYGDYAVGCSTGPGALTVYE